MDSSKQHSHRIPMHLLKIDQIDLATWTEPLELDRTTLMEAKQVSEAISIPLPRLLLFFSKIFI